MLQKILASFLLALLLLSPVVSFAHPLDVSSTTLTVALNTVSGTTFLHPAEVERILGLRGIPMRSIVYGDYYKHQDYIFEYLRDKIRISSGKNTCELGTFSTLERGVDEIFSEGFPVAYVFDCHGSPMDSMDVAVDIFADLPLQTNRVGLYDSTGKSIGYKVLTSSIRSHRFDLSGASVQAIDTDHDGLSDEEELAYRSDPHNPDTDNDNYSDGEEVNNGWNPLSREVSPGQKYREKPLPVVDTGSISQAQDELSRRYMPQTGLLDASGYGGSYLKQVLSGIVAFTGSPSAWSFGSLFLLIALLWFIHAAGPGHSKSLLVAYVLDRRHRLRESLAFALIFTVTHLADIAILVLVTKYLFSVYDPTPYMTLLQRGGAVLLIGFAGFLVIRSVQRLRSAKLEVSPGIPTPSSVFSASNIFLGFFAGLAPCTFGWSIFLVLFSLGKMEWALPLLAALGIGIFLCLLLVVVITSLFREKLLVRVPRFATYSELISAVSIVVVTGVVIGAVF